LVREEGNLITKRRGFTLAEVLIAIFVIVVGVAGVTATIWWALQKQDSGKLMTEASNHARVLFERIQANGPILISGSTWPSVGSPINDEPDARRPLYDPPFVGLGVHIQGQDVDVDNTANELERFTRNIRCTRMVPSNPPDDDYLGELALVQVRVFWQEKNHERSAVLEGMVNHGVNP
jgi:prepilin-type N-terminal cleavage/methylation domain-containing protein